MPTHEGEDPRTVFIFHVNTDGTFTFELTDQIDHPDAHHSDGTELQGSHEETLNIDLSLAVVAHDATPDPIVFPSGTFEVGVIDDTPILINPQLDGSGTFSLLDESSPLDGNTTFVSRSLDDENQPHGIPHGPGDDGYGTCVSGELGVRFGADGPSHFVVSEGEGGLSTVGTNPLIVDASKIVVTNDNGDQVPLDQFKAIYIEADGTGTQHVINIDWTPNSSQFGGGTLTGTADDGHGGTFNVFTLDVHYDHTTFDGTYVYSYDFQTQAPLAHPFNSVGGSVDGPSAWEDNLHLDFTYTATDYDGDSVDGHLLVNVDDDVPKVIDNPCEHEQAQITLDESIGNDASNPGDSTQSNPLGDDTGHTAQTFPLPITHVDSPDAIGTAAIGGSVIAGLFSAHAGADGEGSHEYTLVLRDAGGDPAAIGTTFVETNLKITDFTGTGDPTPVYPNDAIYLVQVSAYQINGVVAGVDGDINTADGQFAFRIVIDPDTGTVTVDQYLAIHHDLTGSSADTTNYDDLANLLVTGEGGSGGIFAGYSLTDGDGDTASAISAAPLLVSFEDDGIGVDVAQATVPDTSGTFVTLDTLTLDETIGVHAGDPNAALDDNGSVTSPSYITAPDSTLAIGVTSTPSTKSGSGNSIADLFTVTKIIGTDGLLNEDKVYSLTLTDEKGSPVEDSSAGVLTNLHVTETGGSPVDHTSEADRAIYLFKVSDTEIVGRIAGADHTFGTSDDFVALRILLDVSNPADPTLKIEQYLPLEHPDGGPASFDESVFLNFSNYNGEFNSASLGVTLTDTVTDGDGDTATGSQTVTLASAANSEISSGTSLIEFQDDGPNAALTINSGVTLAVDETDGGLAPGEVDPIGGDLGHTMISAATLFTDASVFGTDGPNTSNSTVYSLTLSSSVSGLKDTLTGADITLIDNGGVIEGHAGDTLGDPLVFTLSIDSSGDVTLTQYRAVVHDHSDNPDTSEPAFLADGAVGVTVAVTDGDGDTSSATANLNHVVEFLDDGPTAPTVSASYSGTVTVDETPGVDGPPATDVHGSDTITFNGSSTTVKDLFATVDNPGTDPDVAAASLDNGALSFASSGASSAVSLFGVNFGSDGPLDADHNGIPDEGATVYALTVTNPASDLMLTDGTAIALSLDSHGRVIGTVGADSVNPDLSGKTAFAIAIDPVTGQAYVADYLSLHQDGATNTPNDSFSLASGTVGVTVTLTDGDGDHATSAATDISSHISFLDDGPAAYGDTAGVAEGAGGGTADVVFIVDVSDSMNDSVGFAVPTFSDNKIGLARYSMQQLLTNHPEIHNVQFTLFSEFFSANSSHTVWLSRADALTYISDDSHWSAGGSTDYDLALNTEMAAYNASARPVAQGDQTLVYFLSDGEPNTPASDPGITSNGSGSNVSIAEWETFVTTPANDISNVFAIGLGSGVGAAQVSNLEPISYPNTDVNAPIGQEDNVVIIDSSNLSTLTSTLDNLLTGVSPGTTIGNIITDGLLHDNFGADGGHILSIAIDGTTYTWNGVSTITHTGADPGADLIANTGTSIVVHTDLGGTLTFYFATGSGHDAGDWTYAAPSSVPATTHDIFPYVIVDGDGDQATANLDITVQHANGADILTGSSLDDILTGGAGNDTLTGGAGNDTLTGGSGNDHFVYNATNEGLDHIIDFGTGSDELDFKHTAFGNGLASGGADTGTLGSSHFVANGTGPTNANQVFWYNTADHTLYYDADGSGAGAAIAMAKLENNHALVSGEIHMV